jgi:hypothetical protein
MRLIDLETRAKGKKPRSSDKRAVVVPKNVGTDRVDDLPYPRRMNCRPPCLLCHQVRQKAALGSEADPLHTVSRPFGLNLPAKDQIAVFVMDDRDMVPTRGQRPRHALYAYGIAAKRVWRIECREHQDAQ